MSNPAIHRPKLILGAYAVQTVLALLLSQPLFDMLNEVTASSAFVPELLSTHSAMLWTEILKILGAKLGAWGGLLLGILPAFWLINNLLKLGIAGALTPNADGHFWKTIQQFGFKSLNLGLIFSTFSLIWVIICGFLTALLLSFSSSEVWIFWIGLVLFPTLSISGICMFNLFHDYARCYLIAQKPIGFSFYQGIKFPFKNRIASFNHLHFFLLSLVLMLIIAILSNFWVRQILLFLHQFVQNAWLGRINIIFRDKTLAN